MWVSVTQLHIKRPASSTSRPARLVSCGSADMNVHALLHLLLHSSAPVGSFFSGVLLWRLPPIPLHDAHADADAGQDTAARAKSNAVQALHQRQEQLLHCLASLESQLGVGEGFGGHAAYAAEVQQTKAAAARSRASSMHALHACDSRAPLRMNTNPKDHTCVSISSSSGGTDATVAMADRMGSGGLQCGPCRHTLLQPAQPLFQLSGHEGAVFRVRWLPAAAAADSQATPPHESQVMRAEGRPSRHPCMQVGSTSDDRTARLWSLPDG